MVITYFGTIACCQRKPPLCQRRQLPRLRPAPPGRFGREPRRRAVRGLLVPRQFNGGLLCTARNARGWSQSRLAKEASISQGKLSKLENKLIDRLSDDELSRLADALGFPPSFFLEPDDILGLPLSVHPMFRKRSSVGVRHLDQLQAQLNLRLFHIRRLLRSVTVEVELELPEMDVDEFDSPGRIAGLLRRTWGVPFGPFKDLVGRIEKTGCIVVLGDFGTSAVDGVTLRSSWMNQPCIFLNRYQPVDRFALYPCPRTGAHRHAPECHPLRWKTKQMPLLPNC